MHATAGGQVAEPERADPEEGCAASPGADTPFPLLTKSAREWPSAGGCVLQRSKIQQGSSLHLQVFLPELVVLQADPAASVRKFLPEFLETCPPAALPPPSLSLVLQCLQGLLQDSVPAVVKATIMASSNLFRTALAVVIGQVWHTACIVAA